MGVLCANFEVNSDFDILNSIPILSSKEQAILITCRCQYFNSGVTTLVNRKCAKSESWNCKDKITIFFINFPAKPKKSLVFVKHIDMIVPAF